MLHYIEMYKSLSLHSIARSCRIMLAGIIISFMAGGNVYAECKGKWDVGCTESIGEQIMKEQRMRQQQKYKQQQSQPDGNQQNRNRGQGSPYPNYPLKDDPINSPCTFGQC